MQDITPDNKRQFLKRMGLRPDLKASKVGTDQQEGGKKFQNTGARKQKG